MAALTGVINTSMTAGNLDSSRISEVFNLKFLQHIEQKIVLANLVEQFDLPRNAGSLTMRFFRRGAANVDNVRSLTEGTPLTTFTHGTLENVEVTLAQYGDQTKITDTRVATDLIRQMELETARLGEEAALHLDTQIRDAMYTSLTDGANSAQLIDATTRSAGSRGIKAADLDKAATLLSENDAKPLDGGAYVAVVSPRQAYDLRRDTDWQNVANYSDKEKIYSGEIGKLFNVKVVVANNPKTFTHNTSLTGHAAFVFGKEFAGTVKLAGSNSPMKPQLIYNDQPDKSDPMNLYNVVAWKAWYASLVLQPKFGVLIKSDRNLLA